jgi:hypothetical protein
MALLVAAQMQVVCLSQLQMGRQVLRRCRHQLFKRSNQLSLFNL